MNSTAKSVVSAAGVIASVAFVVGGLAARHRTDLGPVKATASAAPIDRLLVSRTDDVNVPAGDYFYELSEKLKEEYVEPVTDDQKLASGAIRGMVTSLRDPQSQYMDKTQFTAFLEAREGKFQGIGADFALVVGPNHKQAEAAPEAPEADATPEDTLATAHDIPRLEVVSVVPGGPADKAKVHVGDIVESVDGHWVVNSDLIRKFRTAQTQFLAKKMPLSQLNVLRTELRAKADRAVYPMRAKDMLFLGKSGAVTVVWDRGTTQRTTKMMKESCSLPIFAKAGGAIQIRFVPGVDKELKQAIAGRSAVTIDLRNNTLGDPATMKKCLEVLAPRGHYGSFVTRRHESPTPLEVRTGSSRPIKITLLVDESTRGVAEIFATALSSHGVAKLEGGPMGGDLDNRSIFSLPDGSGYTLVTSLYSPKAGAVARKGGVK